jgi:molecular chaperone GrpE
MTDIPHPENPNFHSHTNPNPHPAKSAEELAAQLERDHIPDELSQALGEALILKAQIADLKDQNLRAAADVQNARRRADEDVSKARKFGIESFAEALLPVLDSLEAGLALKDATAEQLREGSEATLRQLKSALEKNKVLAIDPPSGEKFEPSKHQAISMVPSEQDANTIVAVLQKGYQIAERVMRPALVTVAAAK